MAGFLALPKDIQRTIVTLSGVPIATIKAVSKGWQRAGRSLCRSISLTGKEFMPRDGPGNLLKGLEDCTKLTIDRRAFQCNAGRSLTIKNILKGGSYESVIIEACPESAGLLSELHHHLDMRRLESLYVAGRIGEYPRRLAATFKLPRMAVPNAVQQLNLPGVPLTGGQLILLAASFPTVALLHVAVQGSIDWVTLSSFPKLLLLGVDLLNSKGSEAGLLQAVNKTGIAALSVRGSDGRFCSFSATDLGKLYEGRPLGAGFRLDVRSQDVSFGQALSDALLRGWHRSLFIDPFSNLTKLTLPMSFLHGQNTRGNHRLRLDAVEDLARALGRRPKLKELYILFGGCKGMECASHMVLSPFVEHSGVRALVTNCSLIRQEWWGVCEGMKNSAKSEEFREAVEGLEKQVQDLYARAKVVGCELRWDSGSRNLKRLN